MPTIKRLKFYAGHVPDRKSKKPYAVKFFKKKRDSNHYAVNRFFTKMVVGIQSPRIQKWTYFSCPLFKRTVDSQTPFFKFYKPYHNKK
jgi:hypothetical protein